MSESPIFPSNTAAPSQAYTSVWHKLQHNGDVRRKGSSRSNRNQDCRCDFVLMSLSWHCAGAQHCHCDVVYLA
eukprot:750222-Amphidinium_carterae.1